MAAPSNGMMRCQAASLLLAAFVVSGWSPIGDTTPTPQDVQIAGRVLHFQETPLTGSVILAIAYNPGDARSRAEATALAALLGGGLPVGDLILRPRLVEQAHLTDTAGYAAIFATIGVEEALLAAALKQHQVPCLTRHLEQVEHGACTVAIGSQPIVSIVVSEANAVFAGVRFATAFRMMVREI